MKYLDTEDGVYLRYSPELKGVHRCQLPDISWAKSTDTYVKNWVWMCLSCRKVYVVKEEGSKSLYAPLWDWFRMWWWNERKWRKRWERTR